MPRKPDRFERRLRNRMAKYYWPEQRASFNLDDCGMSGAEVVKELRKEHRWVERMIKSQWKEGAFHGSVNYGYNQAVEFFLEQLKQRRK